MKDNILIVIEVVDTDENECTVSVFGQDDSVMVTIEDNSGEGVVDLPFEYVDILVDALKTAKDYLIQYKDWQEHGGGK